MIYALWAKGTNYVKIGFTADYRAEKRLIQLQPGCPFELQVLAFADGSKKDEGEFHRLLADEHVRGEWFKWGPKADRIVKMLKAMPEPNPFKKKPTNPHKRLGAALSIEYAEPVHKG